MSHAGDKEQQYELEEMLEYADEETLRAIYAYLAPVELSLTPEQNEALSEPCRDNDENDLWLSEMPG